MLSVRGIYENGQVQLLEPVFYTKRAKVIVTILEETDKTDHREESPGYFTGSLTGVGETAGDLTQPLEDEWETD
ncbi:MAG: hypothetical protein GY749_20640 [Desulfobacteraceae bacterium]|nr:hypothetical protein [Desulfobacteraceae bacterium]MCP4353272.1 hypothetical protein [Desulfobacterales bacterium]